MRAFGLALLSCMALAGAAAAADDAPMVQMDFFRGCWHGVFSGAEQVADERCFEPMLDGRYVRDTHVVHGGEGAYSGETIFYLDAVGHRLAFTYYASDGGVMRGFADLSDTGVSFPPGEWIGVDGSRQTLRSQWRREGPNRYVAISEVRDRGRWREHLRITYVRAPELSPPAR